MNLLKFHFRAQKALSKRAFVTQESLDIDVHNLFE
jgi:hypothetical protein